MGVYFRGGLFTWGLFSVGFISYLELSDGFFRGGLFPRPKKLRTKSLFCAI